MQKLKVKVPVCKATQKRTVGLVEVLGLSQTHTTVLSHQRMSFPSIVTRCARNRPPEVLSCIRYCGRENSSMVHTDVRNQHEQRRQWHATANAQLYPVFVPMLWSMSK